MGAREELLLQIEAVLPPGGGTQLSQSALNDLFEAFVLSAVVQAGADEGWTVRLEDMNEQSAPVALFRQAPGNIYRSQGGQNFTHFALSKSGVPPLEAHIGIKVTGKSDVDHECDVALLPKSAAQFCRWNNVHPRSAKLLLATECKYYAGTIPLNLGRAFVGLATEVHSQYGQCHFVVNTTSSSVMKMLARQKRNTHEEVRPGSQRFQTFRAACRHVLHNYYMRERA